MRTVAAGVDEMAWVFELRDRRIRSWRPYEDRAEALRAGSSSCQFAMADAAPTESIAPRLAAVREQLSLLSDYL